jgi:prepilin-type N-terminal cleavage/methylation domain-containing protein
MSGRVRGRPADDGGFTFVELLIVIVVLGILAGIVVFGVGRFRSDASSAACRADVSAVNAAADAYLAVTGNYPADMADLTAGQYLKTAPRSGTFTFDAGTRTAIRTPACDGPTTTVSAGPTPAPTPTASATASPTTSAATSAAATSPAAGTCTSQVNRDSSWPQGYQASVTVRNTGTSTLSPWTATWRVPASVTLVNGWNATVSQSGRVITAQAPSWQQSLAPGASWTVGYIADGPWASGPDQVTLNGVSCG